ncbi:interferon-induced 44-like protein [Labeo rohita]|uniref:Interferon-induced 44-like protein n=1 Tax=Labeo rohita TaxID=84645 RepID=A0A498M3A9_LABRO|nr:interferon-induced 44-like protein [Labeo rohita]
MFSVNHPDVKHIKILVAGQVGAGKSSFINSVNNAFRGRMTSEAIVDQSSGKSFTKNLKSHRVRGADGDLPFVLTDIMGLQPEVLEGSQPEDIIKAIYGHVKDEYKFNEEEPLSHTSEDYVSDPLLSDQAFCLVYIVEANTIEGIPQVIIMTKVDEACPLVKNDLKKVYTSKKIKEKMQLCSEMIGVPMNCIFPVKNYHDEIDTDDDVDVLILKAFDQIVNFANDRLMNAASN